MDDPLAEIARLRDGEEDGWTEAAWPRPGQYLKRLHELDSEQRIQSLANLLGAAEAAHACLVGMHQENLQELRQRAMNSWSALTRIAGLCRDPERDGLIHVSEIVELLPPALRYG
jgi:hypothetical protein